MVNFSRMWGLGCGTRIDPSRECVFDGIAKGIFLRITRGSESRLEDDEGTYESICERMSWP